MKKKILLSSIGVIAICLCIIAGSTFALFTDTAEVNIAVTAGDLEVTAVVDEASIAMRSLGDAADSFPRSPAASDAELRTFENGGTVSFDATTSTFTIAKMTPGDEITFNIKVTNAASANAIAAKCYFDWTSTLPEGITKDLLPAINFKVYDENGAEVVINGASDYQDLPVGEEVEFTVVASFTNYTQEDLDNNSELVDNNEYKNAGAKISFQVVAVQANAQ